MMLVLPFLLLFGLLFLMNRGEKKKRVALESKLKRGDRVLTRSGIKGKLIELSDSTCKVEIAPGVNVVMLKVAIEGLDPGETPASATGKDAKASSDAKDGKDSKDKKK
jgi:preprotein translocase subunit YajC